MQEDVLLRPASVLANFATVATIRCFRAVDDPVDDAVLDRVFGTKYVVAVGVTLDPLVVLAGALGEDLVHAPLLLHDLTRVDLHVGGLPAETLYGRLVQQDARVGQRAPLALGPGREQERPRRSGHAQRRRGNVGVDELHGVVHRQHRRAAPARRVYVQVDVLLRVLRVQVQ